MALKDLDKIFTFEDISLYENILYVQNIFDHLPWVWKLDSKEIRQEEARFFWIIVLAKDSLGTAGCLTNKLTNIGRNQA